MQEPCEEINHNNNMQMNKHDDSIHILDYINLYIDDTFDDDSNEHVSDVKILTSIVVFLSFSFYTFNTDYYS